MLALSILFYSSSVLLIMLILVVLLILGTYHILLILIIHHIVSYLTQFVLLILYFILHIYLISDPRRGRCMGLPAFIFFFFFSAMILSGPYLWNRYSQRLQIECPAWSCGLILHYCLPSNSLC